MTTVVTESYLREEAKTSSPRKRMLDRRQEADFMYGTLTGLWLWIWRHFLPTSMRHRPTTDTLPAEVHQHIGVARELQLFDRIQIWRPQGNSCRDRLIKRMNGSLEKLRYKDPAAVGIIELNGTASYHPIVRWGPDSLLSQRQMAWYVLKESFKTVVAYAAWAVTWVLSMIVFPLLMAAAVIFLAGIVGAWWFYDQTAGASSLYDQQGAAVLGIGVVSILTAAGLVGVVVLWLLTTGDVSKRRKLYGRIVEKLGGTPPYNYSRT